MYDGNQSLRRRIFRCISVNRTASVETCLRSALAAFHLAGRRPTAYLLTDALHPEEVPLSDPHPLQRLTRRDNKRPAIFLRFRYDCFVQGLSADIDGFRNVVIVILKRCL